ncbi:MAG: hypothetical protein V3U27_01050 [Candidatus Tectomicrobia bacterium]
MADITNAVVIKFSNEELRPISELARNLKIHLDHAKTQYQTTISGLIAGNADTDTLLDGSPDDGRTSVTKKDIVDFTTELNDLITELDAPGTDALISKFTVQPPQIT